MLHNLLPKDTKKNLRNEYVVRMVSMALFLMAAAVGVGAVSLVPTYISISSALDEAKILDEKEGNTTESSPLQELARAAMLLQTLNTKLSAEPMTEIMRGIISVHPDGIQITGVTFDRDPLTFSLQGNATTRDALVTYKKALEGHDRVTHVSSPISDLAKSSDLEFTLTLTLSERAPTTL
jgi:hypothetical protein